MTTQASWTPLPLATYLASLTADAAAFADLVADPAADLSEAVPACPGWSLHDLAEHVGQVHRWAAHALREDRPGPFDDVAPTERAPLAAWLLAGTADLLDLLTGLDPATPRWGFGNEPRTAAFWWRRQAHETAVHLWDARAALGHPVPLDADLAADGIDEVATVFFPRQVRLERCPPLASSLAVHATDQPPVGRGDGFGGSCWVVGGDGLDLPEPAATLRGSANDLLLVLWHRLPLPHPGVELHGDADAAVAVLTAPIVP
jgi:uncharacterized protein (TIGR03083 family)